MDFNSIYALAKKMNIGKEQFESFKYFIYSKYNKQIQEPDNLLSIDFILKKIEFDLSQSKEKVGKTHENKKRYISKQASEPKTPVVNKRNQISKNQNTNPKSYTKKKNFRPINKISDQEAILLSLKIDYIRTKHTVSQFANKLYWDEDSLINILTMGKFENIKCSTVIQFEHIKLLAEQIYDRRQEVKRWENEIVSRKFMKTTPNYFKLIYNSPGSKR